MGEHQRHQQAPWLGKALRQPIDRGAYGRGVELEQVAVDGTAVERVVPLRTRLERRVMPAGEILERGRHREAETIARRARDAGTQHVAPRAGERDVIPSLSQPREDVRLVRREQVLERSMPRHVRVQAREHRDAALCAHAVLRVRVREPHTPRGQRVDRGRAYDRVAERTDAVRAELIGHEQQQVRSAGHEISMPHHDLRGSGRSVDAFNRLDETIAPHQHAGALDIPAREPVPYDGTEPFGVREHRHEAKADGRRIWFADVADGRLVVWRMSDDIAGLGGLQPAQSDSLIWLRAARSCRKRGIRPAPKS
jgi:hypothetical protein